MISTQISLWRDHISRSPAQQMAVDEAIFRQKTGSEFKNHAFLRFYTWEKPATTVGFFSPTDEIIPRTNPVRSPNQPCSFVRRLTGGGIVNHGDDVTFSITAGKNHPLSAKTTTERYRIIHQALADSGLWPHAELVPISAATDSSNPACFSAPVGWDVIVPETGQKIAGGAQRSSRGAWLHQGTVTIPTGGEISVFAEWTTAFAENLAEKIVDWSGDPGIESLAAELEKTRYATDEWNLKKPTTRHQPR